MTTNNITEVKGVDSQNFDYLLAESNYKIDKSLTLRQKSVNVPLVPVLAAPITLDANAFNLPTSANTTITDTITPAGKKLRAAVNDTQKTIPGINIPIDLSAMDNNILDLRDGELSIQAQYYYEIEGKTGFIAPTVLTDLDNEPAVGDAVLNNIAVNLPTFGNQALLSLFQRAELYIDNQLIAANEFPGMSSNAEYALRYPHCKKLEKNYEIHGMTSTDPKKYKLAKPVQIHLIHNGTSGETKYAVYSSDQDDGKNAYLYPKGKRAHNFDHLFDECKDKNQSYTVSAIPVCVNAGTGSDADTVHSYVTVVGILGTITQRIKLADIFPVIDTLPPIYNHKITIKFNRAPTNVLICNTNQCVSKPSSSTITLCRFLGFQQFKWFQDVYKITEQVQAKAKEYYSKTIETIITQDQQILTQIQNEPSKAQTLPFNLNVSAAYKNKLLTICIPRTNNYSNQYNNVSEYYSNVDDNTKSLMVAGPNNTIPAMHYDILKAPANSYTCGYLRQLRVETAGGLELYNFTMENDGFITGPQNQFIVTSPQTMLNYSIQRDGMIKMNNYEDVYRQYVKSRLHFQQSEDEALDYESFLKEYCIFCIDLSPFDLSVNEQLRINMTLADWGNDFNPFHAGNYKNNQYMSPAIICNLFKDKILKLEPDRKCSLADMITAKQSEEQLTNTFV